MEDIKIDNINLRNITVGNLNIPNIPDSLQQSSVSLPPVAPVTVELGVPIVNVPGCVEAHESENKSNTVGEDDKNGVLTFCDAGVPSFNPIRYEPENLTYPTPAPVPPTDVAPEPNVPEAPQTPTPPPPPPPDIQCPTPAQEAKEPVGTLVNGFRERVTEYKLLGNECVQITESVSLPTQIIKGLPSGGQVVQVGSIAVVATTSALLAKPLADILLKAVKPTVKKVVKKIAAIRKKPIPVKSSGERRAEQRQMNAAVKALRSVFPRKKKG